MLIRHFTYAFILGLCLTGHVVATEYSSQPKDIAYPYSEDDFSPCGVALSEEEISLLPPPKETKVGEVSYVSGGVCFNGVRYMKNIASQFPLEIVLVEDEAGKEVYIADVQIILQNANAEHILDVVTEGPFLLARLPEGKYQITAIYGGIEQTRMVKVQNKKHARVVFLWAAEHSG